MTRVHRGKGKVINDSGQISPKYNYIAYILDGVYVNSKCIDIIILFSEGGTGPYRFLLGKAAGALEI